MGQDRSEITEQVVKFPPKQQSGSPADEAGQAEGPRAARKRSARSFLITKTTRAPWGNTTLRRERAR